MPQPGATEKQGNDHALIDDVNILVADPCKPRKLPEQRQTDHTGLADSQSISQADLGEAGQDEDQEPERNDVAQEEQPGRTEPRHGEARSKDQPDAPPVVVPPLSCAVEQHFFDNRCRAVLISNSPNLENTENGCAKQHEQAELPGKPRSSEAYRLPSPEPA